MFGNYFRNLTTNQKIVLGVAVFLVVCVIVYMLYKYVFKAAKNFIQHYIMPTREKFEKIRLNLKTRCKRNQFYNGSACVDMLPRTVIAPSTIPPLSSTQARIRDYLRWVLSYKGSFIKIDSNNPDAIDNFTEQNPNNGFVVIRNNLTQQISPSIVERTDTDAELASGISFRTSNIVISGQISQITENSYDKTYKNLTDALSLCCRLKADSTPDVEKVTLDANGNLPASTTHKVYYNFTRAPIPTNVSPDDRLTGNFTYFIPIRTINFLTPVNNVAPTTLNNILDTSIFAATAYSEYSNALNNCNDYISKFVSVNKKYLKACVATILKTCGLYKSNIPVSDTVDPNFDINTAVLENSTYNVVLNNGVYYLQVLNSPFNCGDGRDVVSTTSTSSPSDSNCVRTDTYQYNDRFSASNNISSDGIFVDACRSNLPGGTTYNVVRGIGSCVGEPCSLTGANSPVKGIRNAFVVQDVDNLQKTFIAGQSVILPPNLVTLGLKANTPSWYQFVNQYEVSVLKDATNSSFEQCTNPSRLQTAIQKSDPLYIYDSTDEITYIRGSMVYVTKRKKAQYRVSEPLSWGIYYSDATGMNITPVTIASTNAQSARNTTGFYFIGAPTAPGAPSDVPQAVPVFIQKAPQTSAELSTLTGAPTYDPERKQRSQSLEVMRNIWIGLDRTDVISGNGFMPLNSDPSINFGRLLAVFFYLITGFFFSDVEAYEFLTTTSPPTPVSVLNWGIAISSPLQAGATLGINSFSYNNFYGLYQPANASGQFNTRSISFDSNIMYFLDVSGNTLNLINNSYNVTTPLPSRTPLAITVPVGAQNFSPLLFRSFPSNVGGILITTSGIVYVYVSNNILTQTSVVNPASGTPPIIDVDTTNLNVIMVGYNPDTSTNCILYGTIVSNVLTLRNVNISNLSDFPNDIFAFSSVKFCNRSSNSQNVNIILTTRFAQSNIKKSGYLYRGTITAGAAGSDPTITLTKIDQNNYDIRSVACSDDATISATPTYISIATYRGPVISYKLSVSNYNKQSISGIGRWIGVHMTSNGQYQAACSEVQSTDQLANDGRIIYADNFASVNDDWRIIPNPKKYIGSSNISIPDRENAPQFDPTNSLFNPLFNSYNFNRIDVETNAGKVYIFSTFSRTFSETSSLAPGNGLLRIELQ